MPMESLNPTRLDVQVSHVFIVIYKKECQPGQWRSDKKGKASVVNSSNAMLMQKENNKRKEETLLPTHLLFLALWECKSTRNA